MITAIPGARPIEGLEPANPAIYKKVLWRLMPLLILCYISAFLNRQNVGFAKLQFMHDLKFTEAIYGVGGGIFYLGYVLFEIPSNLYLAKSGARKTLLRIMVLWGLCSAAMAFMRGPREYYILRCLLGAAEAGLFPGVLLYLTYWVPAARRAYFTALFMFSIGASGIIGGPLSGGIMRWLQGALGFQGWQWLFLIDGLPSCILGVIAYFYLSDNPREAKWLSESEKAAIAYDLANDQQNKASKSHRSFGPALRDPRFYLLVVMAYALLVGAGGIFLWMPTIVRNSGVKSLWDIGLLSAIPFLIGTIFQILVARHSDKTMERRWHVIVPALLGAFGWAMLPFVSKNPTMSLVMLTVVAIGTLSAMGPYWTMPSAMLSGTAAAAGIALITTVGGFGGFISPILVGWLATRMGNLSVGLYYFAGLMLLGVIAIFVAGAPEKPVGVPVANRIGQATAGD
jgi:MFS family permease